jgi:hypothetical protein
MPAVAAGLVPGANLRHRTRARRRALIRERQKSYSKAERPSFPDVMRFYRQRPSTGHPRGSTDDRRGQLPKDAKPRVCPAGLVGFLIIIMQDESSAIPRADAVGIGGEKISSVMTDAELVFVFDISDYKECACIGFFLSGIGFVRVPWTSERGDSLAGG